MKKKIIYISLGIVLLSLITIILFFANNNKISSLDNYEEDDLDRIRSLDLYQGDALVVLDPGHGGEVPFSAPDLQEQEKDDVLRLCLLIRDELEKRNVDVVMTRDSDIAVELEERAEIANDANADLFLSIHRNISDVGDEINGVEIWAALNKGDDEDIYANYIHEAMTSSHIQSDRGIKYGSQTNKNVDYIVNRETLMPSVLIELGFMTNEIDNELYEEYMDEYAENLAKGIIYTLEEIKN